MNPLYARLNPGSTVNDIRELLADLQSTVSNTSDSTDDKNKEKDLEGIEEVPYSPEIQRIIDTLTLSVDQLSDYIDKFQSTQDKTWLEEIKAEASNSINSYTKAYDATTFYTKEWFSRLYLSIDAKVDLAGFLIGIIKPLCNSNLDTLRMIADRDSLIILFISFPRT